MNGLASIYTLERGRNISPFSKGGRRGIRRRLWFCLDFSLSLNLNLNLFRF
jgi:hypothetical protein